MHNPNKLRALLKQRGTAVITALMMVSIAAAVALAMISQQRINIQRTRLVIRAQQAYYLSQGALYWAQATLAGITDPANQQWPLRLAERPVMGGQGRVQAELMPASEFINVNKLSDGTNATRLSERLEQISSGSELSTDDLIAATNAFVDRQSSSDIDQYYLSQTPAYRAAHQPMLTKSEFRLVRGVTPELYEQLQPYLVALPDKVDNAYILTTSVELDGQLLNVYTVLQPGSSPGKVAFNVLWQSRGTW